MKTLNCVLAWGLLFLAGTDLWAIPPGFNIQGRLTDANGINKDGTFQIKFSVFSTATGGSPVWERSQSVNVQNGNFQVILQGQADITVQSVQLESAVKDIEAAYVEIKVGGEQPLVPRQPLLRSPFSPPDNFVSAVMWFYRTSCPIGFRMANGDPVSESEFPKLAVAMGKTGNFNLPDLRGEFVRGVDNRTDATKADLEAPRVVGSTQTDVFQGHYHEWGWGDLEYMNASPDLPITGWAWGFHQSYKERVYARKEVDNKLNGIPRTGSETRPRNVALMPCIKY